MEKNTYASMKKIIKNVDGIYINSNDTSSEDKKIYFGQYIKTARIKNNYSARQLSKLCNISHTELINIEKGLRDKPSIIALKGFEKYLKLDFVELSVLAGYSEDSAKIGNEELIISYDKFDKTITEYEKEIKNMKAFIKMQKEISIELAELCRSVYGAINRNKDVFSPKMLEKADRLNTSVTLYAVTNNYSSKKDYEKEASEFDLSIISGKKKCPKTNKKITKKNDKKIPNQH